MLYCTRYKKDKTMLNYGSFPMTGHRAVMNQLFKAVVITTGPVSG